MRIVAMIERSAGNEFVGEMWTETKVFNIEEPIENIYKWVASRVNGESSPERINTNVKLSIAQE
jgi:hypothetical protein